MQESLSAQETDAPLQLEFDFEGYDAEPSSQAAFEKAETLTIQAIVSALLDTDLFEDAVCMSRMFDGKNENDKSTYFIFRSHDAVTGRKLAVKVTNPIFSEEYPKLAKCLEWESAALQKLKGKKRIQQIATPLKNAEAEINADGELFKVPVSFFSSIYLDVDVRKSFFDEAKDKFKTCANRLNLFCSIICAVQSLHREGFCHRDLKPSNVMGTKKDGKCTAALIDFGFSLARPEIEKELQLFSPSAEIPPMYSAPELYSGFDDIWALSQSADIYSLGCMLFELLDKRTFYSALLEANEKTYWEAVNNIYVEKEAYNKNKEKRLARYHQMLDDFAPAIIIPRIAENSPLPDYVRGELQTIINSMCAFDYRKRAKESELDGIKNKLRRIAAILQDAHSREVYKKRKEIRREKSAQQRITGEKQNA